MTEKNITGIRQPGKRPVSQRKNAPRSACLTYLTSCRSSSGGSTFSNGLASTNFRLRNQPKTALRERMRLSSDLALRARVSSGDAGSFLLRVKRPEAYFVLKSWAIRSVTSDGPLASGNMAISLSRVST